MGQVWAKNETCMLYVSGIKGRQKFWVHKNTDLGQEHHPYAFCLGVTFHGQN